MWPFKRAKTAETVVIENKPMTIGKKQYIPAYQWLDRKLDFDDDPTIPFGMIGKGVSED